MAIAAGFTPTPRRVCKQVTKASEVVQALAGTDLGKIERVSVVGITGKISAASLQTLKPSFITCKA